MTVTTRAMGYTRCLFAHSYSDKCVGRFGKEQIVMVVHMNNNTANPTSGRADGTKLGKWRDHLQALIGQHQVDILMCDMNMCLLAEIPELRGRGVVIEVGAYFPWKALPSKSKKGKQLLRGGGAMCDSCAIIVVGKPGIYRLPKGLDDIHSNNCTGILYSGWPKPKPEEECGFECIHSEGGPGCELTKFLPKSADQNAVACKLTQFLSQHPASLHAVKDAEGEVLRVLRWVLPQGVGVP